jgi:hypothetical protein
LGDHWVRVKWAGKDGQIHRRGAKHGGHARNERRHDTAGSVEEGKRASVGLRAVLAPVGTDSRDIIASVVLALMRKPREVEGHIHVRRYGRDTDGEALNNNSEVAARVLILQVLGMRHIVVGRDERAEDQD